MKNPWFTRVWTVQEDAFSQSSVFLFDRSEIPSHRFTSTLIKWDFVSTSEYLLFDFRSYMRELIQSVRRGGKHEYEGRLRDQEIRILHSLTALQCSQPHDKIFGLYAALVRGGADLEPPDYDKDIILLFQEVIVSFIMRYQRLNPLTITLPTPASTGFPSWVPDWTMGARGAEPPDEPTSIPESSGVFRFIEHAIDESKHATNRARAEILWNSTEKSIQLKAERLGYISARLAVTPSDQSNYASQSYDFGKICQQWFKANEDTLLSYEFETLRDLFCLHIYADTTELATWLHTMRYPIMEDAVAAFQTPDPYPPDYLRRFRDDFSAPSDWQRQAGTVQRDHVDRTINYAFITLDDGQLGRAHHTCQEGDGVWLLAGGQWPMVLRPQGTAGYRIVAPAYIANIMRGERWPEDESQLKRITLL